MKQNIFKRFIALTVCLIMTTVCFADNNNNVIYDYTDYGVSVIFSSTSELSPYEQRHIADTLVYGKDGESNISTYSLCWLTGHKLTTEMVEVVTHKVMPKSPRCLSQVYNVTTCSKCDYEEMVLSSQMYIACCPVD